MSALLDAVERAAFQREFSDGEFRLALMRAREEHSWAELARAAGMTRSGVRHIIHREERKQ